ncbi:unnamed protein product [Camellia sinensis]
MEDQQYQPIEEQAQASVSALANNVDHVDVDEYFASLPSGYRFNPKDAELIVNYLNRKINHQTLPINKIHDVHLYKFNPQYLSENYKPYEEKEWYFFTPRDRKYKNGKRPNRAAGDGYWKATGTDKTVRFMGADVGFETALVFYKGRPPKGEKTNWIMHEYRLLNNHPKAPTVGNEMRLDDCVLCKIYKNEKKSRSIRKRYPDDKEVVPAQHYYNDRLPAENSAMLASQESSIPSEAMEMGSSYNGCVNPNAFINPHFLQTPQLQFNHDQVMMANSTYFNYPDDVNKPPIQPAMPLNLNQPQPIDGMKSNMRPKSMNQNLHCWAFEPPAMPLNLNQPQPIDGMKSNMRPKSMNQNLHCWAFEPRGLDEELNG